MVVVEKMEVALKHSYPATAITIQNLAGRTSPINLEQASFFHDYIVVIDTGLVIFHCDDDR